MDEKLKHLHERLARLESRCVTVRAEIERLDREINDAVAHDHGRSLRTAFECRRDQREELASLGTAVDSVRLAIRRENERRSTKAYRSGAARLEKLCVEAVGLAPAVDAAVEQLRETTSAFAKASEAVREQAAQLGMSPEGWCALQEQNISAVVIEATVRALQAAGVWGNGTLPPEIQHREHVPTVAESVARAVDEYSAPAPESTESPPFQAA